MEKFEFIVEKNDVAKRIDKFLVDKFLSLKSEINRSKIQKLIEEKNIRNADNTPIEAASQKTKLNQKILVFIEYKKDFSISAKEIAFEIIYEDDDLLVINKPAGLTVHPGAGNHDDTLVNALLFSHKDKLSSIGGHARPGIVHRLDKDTSGLMLVAKNDFSHQILSKNLQERSIKRSYLAFIYGCINPARGVINKNIARSRANRLKMAISKGLGRVAITNYQTLEIFCDGYASLLECNLDTGRTHQIRVHLESEKHSLIGDQLYNRCKKTASKDLDLTIKNLVESFSRQALHSYKISFEHPRSKEEMSFEIDLPSDLQELYNALKG